MRKCKPIGGGSGRWLSCFVRKRAGHGFWLVRKVNCGMGAEARGAKQRQDWLGWLVAGWAFTLYFLLHTLNKGQSRYN